MKKSRFFGLGMAACALTCMVVLAGCSKGGGGGGGGGKPNPATDFSYDLTEDGKGIKITRYTGGPGRIVVPATIEDLPVLEIGDKVFDGNTMTINISGAFTGHATGDVDSKENEKAGITSIVIPDTVTKIGRDAFANTAITTFTMPDSVIEIGVDLFSGCEQLTEVHLSDSIETLPAGGSLFSSIFGFGNASIKKINLPKNLKRIRTNVFAGLSELTELVIPETLKSVEFGEFDYDGKWHKVGETSAFNGCGKLPLKTRQQLKDMGYTGEF